MNVGSNGSHRADDTHFVGSNNRIAGNGNTVTGSNNQVTGNNNVGTGSNNRIIGKGNRWTGSNNIMTGEDNSAHGTNNKINGKAAPAGEGSGGIIINGTVIGDLGDGDVVIRRNNRGIVQMITSNGASLNFGGGDIIGNVGDGGTVTMSGRGNWSAASGRIRQLAHGTDNSERKAKKTKKRERSPSPSFIEVPLETDKDEEAPEGEATCVVCISSLPLCAAMPCGHKCLCCKCARELGKDGTAQKGSVQCPVCREKIDAIRRIY